jgi:hypothetical protein
VITITALPVVYGHHYQQKSSKGNKNSMKSPSQKSLKALLRQLLLLSIPILVYNICAVAQDNASAKLAKVTIGDFTVKSPVIDSGTNAAILVDKGDVSFEGNEKGWFNYVFRRTTRILIRKNKSFDLSTVKLLLYNNNDDKEVVSNLTGVTYNIENGSLAETRLNSKDVFEEKYDQNHFYKKFTMPAVREGSIIEYSYTIKSGFIFNLPSWEFQTTDGPTLWSEYNVVIPSLLSYMSVMQGSHKFDINSSGEGFKNYTIKQSQANHGNYGSGGEQSLNVSSPTLLHHWAMKDVPVFYVENYLSSPANYIDKIRFQLFKTYDGEYYHDVDNSWSKVNEELLKSEEFGRPLADDNEWLDKVLTHVVDENDEPRTAAKKIYYYLQDNYTCINHYSKYIKTSLQDVVKKKSGTVGDINLLLIAMLNRQKIMAWPVLLSTTEFGRNTPSYPLMEQLNYVIAKVKIDSSTYWVDAATPFLPFGKLPANCYNGYARVVTGDSVAIYLTPDLLKESRTVNVFISNSDNKQVEGAFTDNIGFYESLAAKETIARTSLNAYRSNLKASFPDDISIGEIQCDSVSKPEYPVSIKFDFKLPAFENADIVYFNPMLGKAIKENPFYAAERVYPVEMNYTTDYIYNLSMDIPTGYKIDELPKSARVMLNNSEGIFEYLVSADASTIQMRCRLNIKKATFTPEDYHTLRDFYAYVVKKESEQMVFKKIK